MLKATTLFLFSVLIACSSLSGVTSAKPAYAQEQSSVARGNDSASKTVLQRGPRTSTADPVASTSPIREYSGRVVKGLLYCIAGVVILCSAYKRFFPTSNKGAGSNSITVLARRELSSRSSLFIVEAEGRRFLLAQGADPVTVIASIDDELQFATALAEEDSFDRKSADSGQSYIELSRVENEW